MHKTVNILDWNIWFGPFRELKCIYCNCSNDLPSRASSFFLHQWPITLPANSIVVWNCITHRLPTKQCKIFHSQLSCTFAQPCLCNLSMCLVGAHLGCDSTDLPQLFLAAAGTTVNELFSCVLFNSFLDQTFCMNGKLFTGLFLCKQTTSSESPQPLWCLVIQLFWFYWMNYLTSDCVVPLYQLSAVQ